MKDERKKTNLDYSPVGEKSNFITRIYHTQLIEYNRYNKDMEFNIFYSSKFENK